MSEERNLPQSRLAEWIAGQISLNRTPKQIDEAARRQADEERAAKEASCAQDMAFFEAIGAIEVFDEVTAMMRNRWKDANYKYERDPLIVGADYMGLNLRWNYQHNKERKRESWVSDLVICRTVRREPNFFGDEWQRLGLFGVYFPYLLTMYEARELIPPNRDAIYEVVTRATEEPLTDEVTSPGLLTRLHWKFF